MVGYGAMGKAHSYGYTAAPLVRELACHPRLRVISGRNADAVARAARGYGFERWATAWREVVEAPDVDIVHVCTPTGTHAEVVQGAAAAGKAVVCEKPLAASWEDGRRALAAAKAAQIRTLIGFNYRRLPALSLMKRFIDEGRIGEPRLWRGSWLSDEFMDPEIPRDSRFERRIGASTIADLGAHLVDLALWMVGEVDAVSATSLTYMRDVDVDDASAALLRFASGAHGVFEVAKVCARRPCDFTVEVNGTRGTLRFDYARLNELWFGDGAEPGELYGMRRIRAEHPSHPETEGWWAIGQGVGYGASFVNQAAHVLANWPDGAWDPDLEVGLRVQAVTEAIERAAASGRWVAVSEVLTPG
jgi:predicted dehydrogenase